MESEITLDSTKRFAAIVFWDYSFGNEKNLPQIYIIDCTSLRKLKNVEKPIGAQTLDIITESLRQVNNVWPLKDHMRQAARIFLEFIYDDYYTQVPNLKMLLTKNVK